MPGHALKRLLQGSWMGHPLHAANAHLPAGLFPAAVVFDLLSRFEIDGSGAMRLAGTACIVLGLLSTIPAAATGLADWIDIKREKPAWKLGLIHAGLNGVVVLVFVLNLVLRLRESAQAVVGMVPLILSAAGAGLALLSVWVGARMVFHHGVSVARHNKDTLRAAATNAGAAVPDEEGGDS